MVVVMLTGGQNMVCGKQVGRAAKGRNHYRLLENLMLIEKRHHLLRATDRQLFCRSLLARGFFSLALGEEKD